MWTNVSHPSSWAVLMIRYPRATKSLLHTRSAVLLITGISSCDSPAKQRMSGLFSFTCLKASVVPGTAWLTTIAFIFGSSARPTMTAIVVSCSSMKLSGYVTCWIIPPSLTAPYSAMRASAPLRSSSLCETVPVTIPT